MVGIASVAYIIQHRGIQVNPYADDQALTRPRTECKLDVTDTKSSLQWMECMDVIDGQLRRIHPTEEACEATAKSLMSDLRLMSYEAIADSRHFRLAYGVNEGTTVKYTEL